MPNTIEMPTVPIRDSLRHRILLVGATGSLGKDAVAEFQKRQVPLRLLGRSWESFEKAGLVNAAENYDDHQGNKALDIVVCSDTTDASAYDKVWFADVKLVVCIARPRITTTKYASSEQEHAAFVDLVKNLSDLVCQCNVPQMLVLLIPYMEECVLVPNKGMNAYQLAEESARKRFLSSSSRLTIARITEMSEAGFLLDFAQKSGIWLCIRGHNPRLQFISSRDFALAIAQFATDNESDVPPEIPPTIRHEASELLVGGPQVVTWRELGALISEAIGKPIRVVDIPLWVVKFLVLLLRTLGKLVPFLAKIAAMIIYVSIPMTTNTTSERHISVGSDRVDDFLGDRVASRKSMPSSRE